MGVADKCLLDLDGKPLLGHVLQRLRPQVCGILLNTNSEPEKFASFGLPVRADSLPGRLGPLAGILTGMQWACETSPEAQYLLSVPSDAPYLPWDMVARLAAKMGPSAEIAVAVSGAQIHPTVGLWPVAFAGQLYELVSVKGIRKMQDVFRLLPSRVVQFPASESFTNINTPFDLNLAHQITGAPLRNIA
jgi:molybdopterin-guanine dinucleotide biosynthesis protein A